MITKNELEKNFLAAMYCFVDNSIKIYYLNNWKTKQKSGIEISCWNITN